MRVALIACSKNKKDHPCAAQEMYSESALFNKTICYCRRNKYDHILILSAKYGVLHPTTLISPYNLTLNSLTKAQRREWALNCYDSLSSMNLIKSCFDFYAGKYYVDELSKLLPNTTNVLKGLGIGQRLQFLNKQ